MQFRDAALLQVLALIGDLAQPIRPVSGALQDHGRLDLVGDRELPQRADAARDYDPRGGRADRERVTHRAHPGRDRDIDVLVRVALVEAWQDPDDESGGRLRTAAHRLHHTRKATAQDDAAAPGDEAADLLGRAERFGRDRVAGVLRALANDRDEDGPRQGAVSMRSRSSSARRATGHANQCRDATSPEVSSYASGSIPSHVSTRARRWRARRSRSVSRITRATTIS